MGRPALELPRRSPPTAAEVPTGASLHVQTPSTTPDAIATTALRPQPQAQPPAQLSLLGEIEAALSSATDARLHAALSTLVTLLHEMRIKFGAAEHLIADDLRAKIKSIL